MGGLQVQSHGHHHVVPCEPPRTGTILPDSDSMSGVAVIGVQTHRGSGGHSGWTGSATRELSSSTAS